MKISTNKTELRQLDACNTGYKTFVEAHGNKDAKLSQCLDSNGWSDVWWLISKTYNQFTDEQNHDLRVYSCQKALINIEKIKPYCDDCDYDLIVSYLNNPTEKERAEVELAAQSAARAAEAVAWAAEKAAEAVAWAAEKAAESVAWATWSAAQSGAWAAEAAAQSEALAATIATVGTAAATTQTAEMEKHENDLRELFIKWENDYE